MNWQQFWTHSQVRQRTRLFLDAAVLALAFVAAHLLRFSGMPPASVWSEILHLLPAVVVVRLVVNRAFGIPQRLWRYVSASDVLRFAQSCAVPSAILLVMRLIFAQRSFYVPSLAVPIGAIIIDYVLAVGGLLSLRLVRRLQLESRDRHGQPAAPQQQRVLLVGAGNAGMMTLREIQSRPDLGLQPCAFLDDASGKAGTVMGGVRVAGTVSELGHLIRALRADLVIITIATPARSLVNFVITTCQAQGVPVRIVPGLYEILDSRIRVERSRPVEIEDLLGRPAIDFQGWRQRNTPFYGDQVVMITGAGGSIGGELARQILRLGPREIVLLDKDEFGIYEIERELRVHPALGTTRLRPVVADVRDERSLATIFGAAAPTTVLHAAAHKHVPLMELNACEAILNNVGGMQSLLGACARSQVDNFVLVSSDKAVNPTNIMGASKRVAELMLQAQACQPSRSRYAAVRFGNVLGSRGSVIPLFREQIRRGGPLTLTHPDMIRYFMTINEAAQLILEAGTMGQQGEIFELDMGAPVRIAELARDMVRLSGYTEDDIEIQYTGIRPGEKLCEELLITGENSQPTRFDKIFMLKSAPVLADMSRLVLRLMEAAHSGSDAAVRDALADAGIGYQPAEQMRVAHAGD